MTWQLSPEAKNIVTTLDPLRRIDPLHLYRLFVDGRFYAKEHGWKGYEQREPGSIEGMSLAYCRMLDVFELHDGLSVAYLRSLHDSIVSRIDFQARKNRYPGMIRGFQVSFLLKPTTCSLEGVRELLAEVGVERGLKKAAEHSYAGIEDVFERITRGESVRHLAPVGELPDELRKALDARGPPALYARARAQVRSNIHAQLQRLVDEYNRQIGFHSGEGKLVFIVDLVKRMIRLHPFVDANARVLISVLLNHLLIRHGFLPAIFEEPSIFDGFTTEEIVIQVKQGQALTEQLLEEPDAPLFGHSRREEDPADQEWIRRLMSSFIGRLHDGSPSGWLR